MGQSGTITPAILTDTDAAVARERERIIELVELKRAKFNIGTRASLALNDVLDQIRARSAKGCDGGGAIDLQLRCLWMLRNPSFTQSVTLTTMGRISRTSPLPAARA